MSDVQVSYTGPLFDGTIESRIGGLVRDVEYAVAQKALALVQANLKNSIRHPSGHYERAIGITNRQDSMLVTDGGIVYGPWLEGVSSLNHKARFKGYASFRRAAQALNEQAGEIANDLVGREIGDLG